MHAHTFLVALLASAVRAVPNRKVFTSQFWTPDVVHSHGTVIRDEPEVKEQAGVRTIPSQLSPSLSLSRASSDTYTQTKPQTNLHQVYICEHHTWGGACEHKLSPLGSAPEDCTVIDGTASSIGPDEGIFCVFYTCVEAVSPTLLSHNTYTDTPPQQRPLQRRAQRWLTIADTSLPWLPQPGADREGQLQR
jgi:hypothetical protein